MTAIILCGGVGSRLKGIADDTPKPLLPVAGKPFLHWLTLWIARQGETDFVFAARHLSQRIGDWIAQESPARPDCRFDLCVEAEPLDTGGAIAFAAQGHDAELFLALNGDSISCVSLRPALEALDANPGLDGAIVGLAMDDASRYGAIEVSADGLLTGFREKRPGAGLVNAGMYLLRRRLVLDIPPGRQSMEFGVFPRWLAAGRRLAVAVSHQPFIDIGTPESLAAATDFVKSHSDFFDGSKPLPQVVMAKGAMTP